MAPDRVLRLNQSLFVFSPPINWLVLQLNFTNITCSIFLISCTFFFLSMVVFYCIFLMLQICSFFYLLFLYFLFLFTFCTNLHDSITLLPEHLNFPADPRWRIILLFCSTYYFFPALCQKDSMHMHDIPKWMRIRIKSLYYENKVIILWLILMLPVSRFLENNKYKDNLTNYFGKKLLGS